MAAQPHIGTPADDEEAASAFFPDDEEGLGGADFFSAVISTP